MYTGNKVKDEMKKKKVKMPFYAKHFALDNLHKMPGDSAFKLIEAAKWFIYDYFESIEKILRTEDNLEAKYHFDRLEAIRNDPRIRFLPEIDKKREKELAENGESTVTTLGNPEFEKICNTIYLKRNRGEFVTNGDYRTYAMELEIYMANGFSVPYVPSNL